MNSILDKPPEPDFYYFKMDWSAWRWEFKKSVPIGRWPKTPGDDIMMRTAFSAGMDPVEAARHYLVHHGQWNAIYL